MCCVDRQTDRQNPPLPPRYVLNKACIYVLTKTKNKHYDYCCGVTKAVQIT